MINKKVFWMLMFVLVFSLFSVLVFSLPPQSICCANSNDCVVWTTCVTAGTAPWDIDGDEDADYCMNGQWADCGTAGSSGVQCQADEWCDTSVNDCIKKGIDSCTTCTKSYECAVGRFCDGGFCKEALTEVGLCSDGIDNDCDFTLDCGDEFTGPDDDCDCCGSSGADCPSGDGDCCSDTNPHTLASVGPKCCDNSPKQWWDPDEGAGGGCVNLAICDPECQSNPFSPNCISADWVYGCCSWEGYLTDKVITTY